MNEFPSHKWGKNTHKAFGTANLNVFHVMKSYLQMILVELFHFEAFVEKRLPRMQDDILQLLRLCLADPKVQQLPLLDC